MPVTVRSLLLLTLFIPLALTACQSPEPASSAPQPTPKPPLILGADISALAAGRPRANTPAYQENGQPSSELAILMNHGWTCFRLRVFVPPVRQAPNNSLDNTIALAKQIKSAGAIFMLDIHYSDTWADPQHQETPIPWRSLDAAALEKQVETYTQDVLTQLQQAGASPDMVQVGNEITGGMLWPLGHVNVPPSDVKTDAGRIQPLPDPYDDAAQWSNLLRFIQAGTRGVRVATVQHPVKIVIHIDCGGDWPITQWYFDKLTAAHVDYDIIGQSFYPNWHGTLAGLENNVAQCGLRYHKPVMVVETGYPQSGGTQITSRKYMLWPGSKDGQLQFMADLVNTVNRVPNGIGVLYWAPEGRTGNGMWNPDGSPAPAVSVLNLRQSLTTQPASHLPPVSPERARVP